LVVDSILGIDVDTAGTEDKHYGVEIHRDLYRDKTEGHLAAWALDNMDQDSTIVVGDIRTRIPKN
jgi:hypothetical protein